MQIATAGLTHDCPGGSDAFVTSAVMSTDVTRRVLIIDINPSQKAVVLIAYCNNKTRVM